MLQVNIHEAKTQLSMLVEKATKTMAKVIPFVSPGKQQRRVGFLSEQASVPDDFDRMGGNEIAELFEGP